MTPEVYEHATVDGWGWTCYRVECVGTTKGHGKTRDEAIFAWVEDVERRRKMPRPMNEVAPIVFPKNDWAEA